MKQHLWILNSSLLGALSTLVGIHFLLLEPVPTISLRTPRPQAAAPEAEPRPPVVREFIYQNDIFGTFRPSFPAVSVQSSITPVPNFVAATPTPPPPIKKAELSPPLTLTLNGIVLASDQEKSIAMIADETNREAIYHIGDSIKDSFIAKISRNRVVLFRSNGQQETFFLRKEDLLEKPKTDAEAASWDLVIKKLDKNQYQLDPREFAKKVSSLGACMEMLGSVPVFKSGNAAGMRIRNVDKDSLGNVVGFQANDIITSINGITLTDEKNLLKAYEEIVKTKPESTISLSVQRNKTQFELSYLIKPIDRPHLLGGGTSPAKETSGNAIVQPPAELSKPNPALVRQEKRKKIEEKDNSNYYDTIMKIRKRLLDNMRTRSPHTRVR
jgi:type II secretion system protein C